MTLSDFSASAYDGKGKKKRKGVDPAAGRRAARFGAKRALVGAYRHGGKKGEKKRLVFFAPKEKSRRTLVTLGQKKKSSRETSQRSR